MRSTAVGGEECSNMWHTYLEQVFIFLKGLMRVIIKTEVRKMIFGHAVIAWIFFLIFYYCKILNFGLLKVRFRRKKQKDVKDDGSKCTNEGRFKLKVFIGRMFFSPLVTSIFPMNWSWIIWKWVVRMVMLYQTLQLYINQFIWVILCSGSIWLLFWLRSICRLNLSVGFLYDVPIKICNPIALIFH